jgi:hypothetical protein
MDTAYSMKGGGKDCMHGRKARRKKTTRKTKTYVGGYIKMDLGETGWDGMVWTGLIWLRIGISGGLL